MKKYLMTVLMFCTLLSSLTMASVSDNKKALLDFTLNYKPQTNNNAEEHVMKNAVKLSDNKWQIAGKLTTAKNNDVLLFMVRMASHKNNKYNLEFMLIDSRNEKTYVTTPRITAITGLPVQLTENNVQLNVLVNI